MSSKPTKTDPAGSSESLFALQDGDIDPAKKKVQGEPAAAPAGPASASPEQQGDAVRGSLHQGSGAASDLRLDIGGEPGASAPASGPAQGGEDPSGAIPYTPDTAPSATPQLASIGQASDVEAGGRPSTGPESATQGSGSTTSGSSQAQAQAAAAQKGAEKSESGAPSNEFGTASARSEEHHV